MISFKELKLILTKEQDRPKNLQQHSNKISTVAQISLKLINHNSSSLARMS